MPKARKKKTPGRPRKGMELVPSNAALEADPDLIDSAKIELLRGFSNREIRRTLTAQVEEDWPRRRVPPSGVVLCRVMAAARDALAAEHEATFDPENLRSESLRRYRGISISKGEETRDQIRALERIDSIFGFDAKYRQAADLSPEAAAARARDAMEEMEGVHKAAPPVGLPARKGGKPLKRRET